MVEASKLWMPGPWGWTWGWYQKISTMFIWRASMLNIVPKIHGRGIKTVNFKASGPYFITPYWARSWHWVWYQKIPIMLLRGLVCWTKSQKFKVETSKLCMQGLRTPFSDSFLGLRSAHVVAPKIWPDQVTHLCSAYAISKNHLSSLVVSEE